MPNFYNTYPSVMGQANFNPYNAVPIPYAPQPQLNMSQYMISVDGEMAARAWQMPANLPPNTIIPLWDLDGKHVYFRSTDNYGRVNPLKKGTVVFEDDQTNLPQVSQQGAPIEMPDLSKYITKDDFDNFKNEMKNLLQSMQQNQNGSNYRNNGRGGDNK